MPFVARLYDAAERMAKDVRRRITPGFSICASRHATDDLRQFRSEPALTPLRLSREVAAMACEAANRMRLQRRMILNVTGSAPVGDRVSPPSECGARGPRLALRELAALREVCRELLVRPSFLVTEWAAGFEPVRAAVSRLEMEFRSGMPLAGQNASEFLALRRHTVLLQQEPVREYLCRYYREVLHSIRNDDLLGRIVARYDEAFYFSAALGNLLDDEELADILPTLTSSYENFLVLKDYFVLACTKGLEEWSPAIPARR